MRLTKYLSCSSSDPVHTTPEEFENGGFNLKTHQMFSVHTTPEKFENSVIAGQFGLFCVWGKLGLGSVSKSFVFKKFPSTLKRKAGVFKLLRFEECFRKASFLQRINVDRRPNWRNKAAFLTATEIILWCDCTFCLSILDICFAVSLSLYRMTRSGPVRNLSLQAVHTETNLKCHYKRYIEICTTQPWDSFSIKIRKTGLC